MQGVGQDNQGNIKIYLFKFQEFLFWGQQIFLGP